MVKTYCQTKPRKCLLLVFSTNTNSCISNLKEKKENLKKTDLQSLIIKTDTVRNQHIKDNITLFNVTPIKGKKKKIIPLPLKLDLITIDNFSFCTLNFLSVDMTKMKLIFKQNEFRILSS